MNNTLTKATIAVSLAAQFAVSPAAAEIEAELVYYCAHLQTVKCRNSADFAGLTEK